MSAEIALYSPERYARYMQCLEAFSFNDWVRARENVGIWPERYFERIIKLHALFGGRIVITSITPIGSTLLLWLFTQPDFRDFLEKFPSFLELKCNFNRDIDDSDERHLIVNRVLAGLKRTLDSDWTSSLFPRLPRELQTGLVKTAAESVVKSTEGYSSMDLRATKEKLKSSLEAWKANKAVSGERHIWLLQAVPEIVHHFINNQRALVSRSEKNRQQRNVYQIVESARLSGVLDDYDADLEFLLAFVAGRCGANASFSRIITTSENASDLSENERRKLLATACYAYNHQLVEAIGDCFGSYIRLSDGAPVGLHTGDLHSAVIRPYEPKQYEPLGLRVARMLGINFDLDKISWKNIKEAMDSDEIARTAVYFQYHLHDKRPNLEAAIQNLNSHANNLAKHFESWGLVQRPKDRWLWFIGLFGGIALVVVGGTVIDSKADATGQELSRAASGGVGGARLTAQAVHRYATYVTADILQNAAKHQFLAE